MTYAVMPNLSYQDLVTEEHLDRIRENIEHLASMKFNGTALSDWAASSEIRRIATGSYSGNGADNRDITISPAFQPKFVLIIPDSTGHSPTWRIDSMIGDKAFPVVGNSVTNSIQAMNADGFQIGSDARVNYNSYTHFYIAIG